MNPHLDGSEPNWVSEMYGANPDVNEVVAAYEAFYKTNTFEKNIHTQNYKHWLKNIAGFINDDGFIVYDEVENNVAKQKLHKAYKNSLTQKQMDTWTSIGPFETYADDNNVVIPVSWQVNIYCLDQSVSNPNIVYAGSEGQGAWKSLDKGLNWSLITKDEDFGTVTDIKVAPSNANLVFLAAGGQIYKSTNGGASWLSVYTVSNIYEIAIHPTNPNIVFAVGANGLYRTANGGNNWTQQQSSKFWDINFHPTNPSIVYTLRHNSTLQYAEFLKSTDTGNTWNQIGSNWYDPTDPTFTGHQDIGALIAVTPIAPDNVYVAMLGNHKADDNTWIGMYRSTDAGASWVNPIQDGGPYTNPTNQNLATIGLTDGFSQGFYDFGFDASHTVPGKLYIGVLSLSVTEDDGDSWTRIGGYSVPSASDVRWIHPDVQDIHVLNNDVWVATDGGINYSNNEFATHESRKKGLAGSHFWGFAQGWNEDILVGGRYHNGNSALYEVYGVGNSTRLGGGEAPTGYVDLLEPRTTYFGDISTRVLDPSFVGKYQSLASLSKYPHESFLHAENSEIVRDPRYAHHLYLGASTGSQDGGFWKSTNNGGSFELLHNFGNNKVTGIEISRQDPNVLYCVYDGSSIFRTNDGGLTWNPTATLPTNGKKLISINPENSNELWVFAHTSNNTNKVFRTLNGGASWDNMTTATLAGHTIKDGFYQAGNANGRVYIVAPYDLFYWDNASNDWVSYRDGLPFVLGDVKNIFKPFYRDNKIRLSSVRGIWEAPFESPSQPLAYPMTTTDKVLCSRDTIQFDCHSVLNHQNASWQWTITPTPLWMSSTTVRNPKALLENGVSYTVTLAVTDGNGVTDSKTISNMISVLSECEVDDSSAGSAMDINASGWMQTPNFGITTNNMTMTAWVKPTGIQPEFSGIVINDGTAAGMNFRENNNTLGYHWPGGAWWWDSGLEVPADEWSHVAMVATPTSMTVYLNGVASVHTTNLDPVDISTFKIGSYQGWTSRNVTGQFDEVCIYNRALSQHEIRALRHLTKIPSDDTSLIAYYQFNDSSSSILDRANINHGALTGNTTLPISTAPVGGGESQHLFVNSSSTFDFANVGVSMSFNFGTHPNGEVYVSRLDLEPDSMTNNNPTLGQYWIINNYGLQNFSGLSQIKFTPDTAISPHFQSNPNNASLITRFDNEHLNNWVNICSPTSATSTDFVFNNSCGISNFGQYLIYDNNCPNTVLYENATIPKNMIIYAKQYVELKNITIPFPYYLKVISPETLIHDDFMQNNATNFEVVNEDGCN